MLRFRHRLAHAVLPCVMLAAVARPLHAQAAVAPDHSQIVSISPLSLIFGLIGAEYERRQSSTSALGASGSFYRNSDFSYSSIEGKYRYYPQGRALEGFAVSLTGGVTRVGTRGSSDNSSGTAYTVGTAVDYQWLTGVKKEFVITLGLGARRLFGLGEALDGASVVLPTARISIGRAFR